MRHSIVSLIYVVLVWAVLLLLSSGTYTVNNCDYWRVVHPFIEDLPCTAPDPRLTWPLRASFRSLWPSQTISVYGLLVYGYAAVLSGWTLFFDLKLMSALWKLIYVAQLFMLSRVFFDYRKFSHYVAFAVLLVPLCSSSILAFLASFYQDLMIVVTLPALCCALLSRGRYSTLWVVVLTGLVAGAKTQFFYFPVLVFLALVICHRPITYAMAGGLLAALILALGFVAASSDSVLVNRYHANYFGGYLYEKLNHAPIEPLADVDCIGVDAWGLRYDVDKGLVDATVQQKHCFDRHRYEVTLANNMQIFIRHPLWLLQLPFDQGVRRQMTDDYFNLYYDHPYIISTDPFISALTRIKSIIIAPWRLELALLSGLIVVIARRWKYSVVLLLLSSFSISQFYVVFMAEGYRDLSKHLFAMNFSCDLMLFVSSMWAVSAVLHPRQAMSLQPNAKGAEDYRSV